MTSRTRVVVLSISAPVIAFAIVGGFLGKVMAREDKSYQGLKMFDDVTQAITSRYVEPVDGHKVMKRAQRGGGCHDPDGGAVGRLRADRGARPEDGGTSENEGR